jgi:putative hydrolase
MGDSIFDRLFELFQSPGPVNWKLAAEVRKSLTGTTEPVDPHLAEEYGELVLAAQLRLDPITHLDLSTPRAAQPVDGTTWAESNAESFAYAVEPLSDVMSTGLVDPSNPMAAMMGPIGPAVLGMQAGSMVGFMAHRVLGQFDTGLPAFGDDNLYLVVPNIESFAVDHGLDAREVRMWAAGHEVIHHAVVRVPWLHDHLADLLAAYCAEVQFDPGKLTGLLSSVDDPSELEDIMEGPGGLASMLGAENDAEKLPPIQAVVAAIAGYGDHVVRKGLADVLPDLDRLEEAEARRRVEPDQSEQFLQQLAGMALERQLANDAASFFAEVERRWGAEAVATVWSSGESVPTVTELADPVGWAARVLLDLDALG